MSREREGEMKSIDVTVVDRCEGCKLTDIDLSRDMFGKLAPEELGRVSVKWEWLN